MDHVANYWLLKTEPSTYSYDDLELDAKGVWDGVANPVALRNLRAEELVLDAISLSLLQSLSI